MIYKIKNVLRGLKQGWGSARIKQRLWDKEYAGGRWDLCKNTIGDPVYGYLAKHINNGEILELGCGTGNTGNEIEPEKYRGYTGVDISSVAIQSSIVRSETNGRGEKNRYVQSDILTFVPDRNYNVILFRESIYYIPLGRLKLTLDRYKTYLDKAGVFIVTVFDREGYMRWLKIIEKSYEMLERYSSETSKKTIIVFR